MIVMDIYESQMIQQRYFTSSEIDFTYHALDSTAHDRCAKLWMI